MKDFHINRELLHSVRAKNSNSVELIKTMITLI